MATTQTSTKAAPKQTPSAIAKATVDAAAAGNWTLAVNTDSGSVSVTRIFRPGDIDAYLDADTSWGAVLSIPKQTRPGSVWGTDSGSVGGAVGLDNGYYRMNKSGISKQVIDQLVKLGAGTTNPPVRGLLDATQQASSLFTQRQEATPTNEEESVTTATKSTRSKPKGATSKGSVSKRTATRSSTSRTPTAVSPVSSTADVDRLKAIYDTAGVAEMRIEACRIAALEGAAKKEALKSGATPPPMPVNDWMASEDYQQRRNGQMSQSSSTTRGTARRAPANKSTSAEKHASCPLCGFKFTKPQAKCMSTAACEKRQAEAKAKGKATTSKPKTTTAKSGASRLAPQPKPGKRAAARSSKPRSGRVTKRTAA